MFTIDNGIPVPDSARAGRSATGSKYPFADMAVGSSFGVPDAKPSTLRSACAVYAKKHTGVKFAIRAVEGGTRVWRTA